jgi:hypothetical protein
MQLFGLCSRNNIRYLISIAALDRFQMPQIAPTAHRGDETILAGKFAGKIRHGSVMAEY